MTISRQQSAVVDKLFELLDYHFKEDIETDKFNFYVELAELARSYPYVDRILTKKTKKILEAWYAAMNAMGPIDEAEWAVEEYDKKTQEMIDNENPF